VLEIGAGLGALTRPPAVSGGQGPRVRARRQVDGAASASNSAPTPGSSSCAPMRSRAIGAKSCVPGRSRIRWRAISPTSSPARCSSVRWPSRPTWSARCSWSNARWPRASPRRRAAEPTARQRLRASRLRHRRLLTAKPGAFYPGARSRFDGDRAASAATTARRRVRGLPYRRAQRVRRAAQDAAQHLARARRLVARRARRPRARCGIDLEARAETLDVEAFARWRRASAAASRDGRRSCP